VAIRTLLADDQVLARMGIRVLLEDAREIEIVGEASSGREAIALARDLRPDVVLMDVKMGDGDGIEATRTIREVCPTTQVLMLSVYGDPRLLQRAASAGAAGYVLKDVLPVELIAAIKAVHGGKSMIAPDMARQLMDQFAVGGAGDAARRGPSGLTEREMQVLVEVARGLGDKEIATKMCLSESTVKSHLRSVYRRLGIKNRAHAAAHAIEQNLVNTQLDAPAARRGIERSWLIVLVQAAQGGGSHSEQIPPRLIWFGSRIGAPEIVQAEEGEPGGRT
jgi:DNA-binding NarL/FixJ family response regulator